MGGLRKLAAVVVVVAGTSGLLEAQVTPTGLGLTELNAAMLADSHEEELSSFAKFMSGIEGSGYINVGYTYNFHDSESTGGVGGENPGRIFDVFHNEFTVHQRGALPEAHSGRTTTRSASRLYRRSDAMARSPAMATSSPVATSTSSRPTSSSTLRTIGSSVARRSLWVSS